MGDKKVVRVWITVKRLVKKGAERKIFLVPLLRFISLF